MKLFNIFKENLQPKKNPEGKILLAMPLFINGDRYDLNLIIESLKNYWGLNVSTMDENNDTAVLVIDGEMVAVAFMPLPVPADDIAETAQYAYNWPTAAEDLKDHNGHSIVSVMTGKKSAMERSKLLSKVLYSMLNTSNAVGVYQGSQSLLIPKGQYLRSAEVLKSNQSPVDLWVYIGLIKTESGNSAYTFGLTDFGKQEIEVINSKLNLEELYDFIVNICAYVIDFDVTLNSGETLGYTAEQKIKITSSKGHFIDGQSLKLQI
jgi:hypothetical protein